MASPGKPRRWTEASHGPWYYQQTELGYNYRLTDLQAALGLSQLRRLDEFLAARRRLADRYDRELACLPFDASLAATIANRPGTSAPSRWRRLRRQAFSPSCASTGSASRSITSRCTCALLSSPGFCRRRLSAAEALLRRGRLASALPDLDPAAQDKVVAALKDALRWPRLGTVQFGLDYGITNPGRPHPATEVRAILGDAADHGVTTLDTAALYGDAEAVLGATLPWPHAFRIISKTLALDPPPCLRTTPSPRSRPGYAAAWNASAKPGFPVSWSIAVDDLPRPWRERLFTALEGLRQDGAVDKIGASVTPGKWRSFSNATLLTSFNFPQPLDQRHRRRLPGRPGGTRASRSMSVRPFSRVCCSTRGGAVRRTGWPQGAPRRLARGLRHPPARPWRPASPSSRAAPGSGRRLRRHLPRPVAGNRRRLPVGPGFAGGNIQESGGCGR